MSLVVQPCDACNGDGGFSLRHVWTHPAFPAPEVSSIEASRKWIDDYAATIGEDYHSLCAIALDDNKFIDWGDNDPERVFLHLGENDEHGAIDPEFWRHLEIVTGRKITKRAAYFTCAC